MTDYEYPAEQCEDCEHQYEFMETEVCRMGSGNPCSSMNPNNDCALFKLHPGPKTVRRDKP